MTSETRRYNVGIDPDNDDAITEAESRAVSVIDRIEFGSVRTVIVGLYTESDAKTLSEYPGIAYVEIDEAYGHHER